MAASPIPAGYSRWLMYWFKCPACGYESTTAIATVPVPHNLQTLYRFWCPGCTGYSVLKYPKRKGWAVLGTYAVAGAVFFGFAPNWAASGIAAAVVLPVAWTVLNRLTRDYVPDPDA